jgi:predicted N-formylglutamate amidohydrolase
MPESIYLSSRDVFEIAHHAHWIPASRGFTRQFMADNFPGWSFNEIFPRLNRAGLIRRLHQNEFSPRHLLPGAIGVEIDRRGNATADDGSSRSPARLASWDRSGGRRISEHLSVTSLAIEPVIIHTPHASRHIPIADRSDIVLSDSALTREIQASTDQGVDRVARLLSDLDGRCTVAAASLSRLVFDPERFAVGDPTEAAGRGLVYTRTATGRPLREPLTDEQTDWYRTQHEAYTRSMEHLVETAISHHERALIIDLHSYPSSPQAHEDQHAARPEVCIGTDPVHTPLSLINAARVVFKQQFEIGFNTPYAGAYVPGRYLKANAPLTSVMIEVRRDVLRTGVGRARVARAISELISQWE